MEGIKSLHFRSTKAAEAFGQLEFNALTLGKAPVAILLYIGVVDRNLPTGIFLDDPEAFVLVEPLDSTGDAQSYDLLVAAPRNAQVAV